MLKKKEPVKLSKSQANDLAVLVARMQGNADQVEKNVLQAEEVLAVDTEREKRNQRWLHQKECADNLTEAEGLLKDLFMDVDKIRRLQHPQASEIERDVKNLHDRWAKDCAGYRDLYDQVREQTPKITWTSVLDDKLKQLRSEPFGPGLADVEKQIAAQNILHQEVEAYGSQLQPSSASSPEQFAAIKEKYAEVMDASQQRRSNLTSLYEYMQNCNKELVYLSSQKDRILQRDWSDRMPDAPGIRTEYERFKNNGLMAHETEVNQLQIQGDRLLQRNHPGADTIQTLRDATQNEWQAFLNLCLAQETHLDNLEEYKKFQLEAETLSESLDRLNSNLEPRSLDPKSSHEVLLALEADEPALKRNEARLASLRDLSSSVVPLKLRRIQPTKPTTVLSLCDWADQDDLVRRGEELTLKSNSNNQDWELRSTSGRTYTLPGACFMIPPPDAEALDKVKKLEHRLSDLKSRRSVLVSSLKTPAVEVVRPQKAASVSSPPDDPKAVASAARLDKINACLARCKHDTLGRLRMPLDSRNPTGDLETRLREHEASVDALRKLESEKTMTQKDVEPLLAHKSLGPITSSLPLKLRDADNQIDDLEALMTLYQKKATASMFLERQMLSVDKIISESERQLVDDGEVLNQPNTLTTRNQRLQNMKADLLAKKGELTRLGKDLDATKQASSSLQQSFNEFCPDLRRQESEVKRLKNRFTNVNNQLEQRSTILQDANNKNQDFQSAAKSLDLFLVSLPDNSSKPNDSVQDIVARQNAQRRVVEDIRRKSGDLERVKATSLELQELLNAHEVKSSTYRSALNNGEEDDDDELALKRRQGGTMVKAIQNRERDLVNLYSRVLAENELVLQQLELTRSIKAQNENRVNQVVASQQLQLQSQKKDLVESEGLRRELNEEIDRRQHAENDLETYRKRFVSLKSRRGVERLEEKEVVHYYRDPKVEADLHTLKGRIQDEGLKRTRTHSEIEIINDKVIKLETQLSKIEPKLITKVLTEYERDPQLDREAEKIREEMNQLRMGLQTRDSETVSMKTELTLLGQQKPKIRERVVKKEVVRLEKDPQMLKAVLNFQNEIAEEEAQCKLVNDKVFAVRSQINSLERVIPTIQPKIVTKVVKQVQQDPESLEEAKKLRVILEEEKDENAILMKDLTMLQLRYGEVEKLRPKVEVKEIINEIYQIDPETDVELVRLRKALQDSSRSRSEMEKEISIIMKSLTTLRAQKPKVEYKEVTQEVIKEEKSPEVLRELQRLNNQVSRLTVNYDSTLELLTHLRMERDELKAEKSKVEMKLVNKEFIKYENDPLLEKEVDRLRRTVREEIHNRRSVEEILFDLQNQYIVLERQKPEEKIVMQEVVRLQKDPNQIYEHDKLNKSLDDEVKTRRKLEQEVRQLRALVQEKQNMLAQMDDRKKKIQVESELRQINARILELESSPPPLEEKIVIEEVLKVERDPKLEKLTDGIRVNLENECNNISRMEREIRNLRVKLELLQKEKSLERVVYREVVRVEKDPSVEAERERLRDLVTQERNLRRDQEDNMQNITIKINHLNSSKSMTSQEEITLVFNRDTLLREKEDLLRQLKMIESERQNINISFQHQSKLVSERNQTARQRSLKTSTEVQRMEKAILGEKDKIHQLEKLIGELQGQIVKEDQTETHTRETNLSTKITILDPETGKDMSPYDAYVQGLIDRNQYIHLSTLECDWEEITSTTSEGDTMILQDRKSGKQFSVKDALHSGRLTLYDLNRYKDGKMSISEFALLVAGESKKAPVPPLTIPPPSPRTPTRTTPMSPLNSMSPSMRSSYPSLNTNLSGSSTNLNGLGGEEYFPISGILDTTTESRMSVRSALTRKLIDADTALKLLEAQAASGGIVDLNKKDKLSVHKAAESGLIDNSHMYKLLNAQKAFTGVEDPVTKERLAVGQAAQKGYIPKENAIRYMEAQYLTGGLVDPNKAGRLSVEEALSTEIIDSATAKILEDASEHTKELLDPVSKEKISYKQAMDLCKRDASTGLLLLPAVSTGTASRPSYSNFRFSSSGYNM